MLKKLFDHKKSISFILGLLAVGALPPYYHLYLLFISFTGFFFLLNQAQTSRKAFTYGYWFGFSFFAFGFSWVGNALLIDAANFGWLYPISLLGSGLFFGFFTAFPAYFTHKFFKNIYCRFLALAIFWTLFEWLRSFILTGFPWNLLGSILAFDITFIQLSDIFGTYGLSLLVVLLCSVPAVFLLERNSKNLILMITLLLFIPLGLYTYGSFKLKSNQTIEKSDITIRIVQPSIPQKIKWDEKALKNNLDEYISISKTKSLKDIDFTIWGETASPFPLDMDLQYLEKVTDAVSDSGYLVTGSIRYVYNSTERMYQPANALMVIDKQGNIKDIYDKSHLVPFGEYIPLKKFLPPWIRPITNVVANFKQGSGNKTIKLNNYPSFGGLICYEIIFPSQITDKKNRPQWLVNVTNDGWYGESSGPYQHLVTTQLRAVEEGLTIVRVANSGISAVISKNGEILGEIPLNAKGFLDINLPRNLETETLYSICGNYLIVILCLACAFLLFFGEKSTFRKT
ncbi:MAG: apolipoprotein N-acyltransferase [Alphaproteobacteria bacterium]|nr:apolipoprotein N-acyltransferase [Alphaproteobacteria bacterium]